MPKIFLSATDRKIQKNNVLKEAVRDYPQDSSLDKLKILESDGFTKVDWKGSGRSCDRCSPLYGKSWDLPSFLDETMYDAPIYSHSHVGCKCSVIVYADGKDPVIIEALD